MNRTGWTEGRRASSERWLLVAVVAVLAVLPLFHAHALSSAYDAGLDSGKNFCGACITGGSAPVPAPPQIAIPLPAPEAIAEMQASPSDRLIVRDSASRAPPVVS